MHQNKGFTLIELMVVISIIGILSAIAIPNFLSYRNRSFICEGMSLFGAAKKNVSDFYDYTGAFPENNQEAGLPQPENFKGKYVENVTVDHGAITVRFYKDSQVNKSFGGCAFTYRPAVPINNPTGHVIWLTKKDEIPSDMKIFGKDYTDIEIFK